MYAASADADFIQVNKANKISFPLVNYLLVCSSPDTTDTQSGQAACVYNGPTPGECALEVTGKGNILFQRKTNKQTGQEDLFIKWSLAGLNLDCNGATLFPRISFRQAHKSCTGGNSCVVIDTISTSLESVSTSCVVQDGKCKAAGFLTDKQPSAFAGGKQTTIINLEAFIFSKAGTVAVPGPVAASGIVFD